MTPATAPDPQQARERLAHTRQALLRHMQQERGDAQPYPDMASHGAQTEPGRDSASAGAEPPPDDGPGSAWPHLRRSLGAWWQTHPARLALEVAQPVCERYARAHPLKVLGVSAATGAVLVLARPWRLISITGLLVAALKSSQMSALAAALLRPSPARNAPSSSHRHDERTHP